MLLVTAKIICTTVTVFAFLKVVLKYLKTELPAVKKIHYFTDGCAGQYKNKNNFINLCHHEDDFGQQNGTLHRPYNDQILTSDAIINFCNENIHGIKFFNVLPEDVAPSETELKARFELARTVKGTLQFHRFVPVSKSRLHVNIRGRNSANPFVRTK